MEAAVEACIVATANGAADDAAAAEAAIEVAVDATIEAVWSSAVEAVDQAADHAQAADDDTAAMAAVGVAGPAEALEGRAPGEKSPDPNASRTADGEEGGETGDEARSDGACDEHGGKDAEEMETDSKAATEAPATTSDPVTDSTNETANESATELATGTTTDAATEPAIDKSSDDDDDDDDNDDSVGSLLRRAEQLEKRLKLEKLATNLPDVLPYVPIELPDFTDWDKEPSEASEPPTPLPVPPPVDVLWDPSVSGSPARVPRPPPARNGRKRPRAVVWGRAPEDVEKAKIAALMVNKLQKEAQERAYRHQLGNVCFVLCVFVVFVLWRCPRGSLCSP